CLSDWSSDVCSSDLIMRQRRSHRFMLPLVLLALAFVMAPASRVAAHEEGNSVITLRAPLDAADCTATPPTITVLGLTIDVSTARSEARRVGKEWRSR